MRPNSEADKRRRGRKPADAAVRREAVERALQDFAEARVPFTMNDVAERAGISRATLYRDAMLRDLIGQTGDGPKARPVNGREFDKLREANEKLTTERRQMRRELREAQKRMREAEARVIALDEESRFYERTARKLSEGQNEAAQEKIRTEAYATGFTAGARAAQGRGGAAPSGAAASAEMRAVASRLPRPALMAARRTLAQKLHPDLFAKDPAAALLATEILKQLNALISEGKPS